MSAKIFVPARIAFMVALLPLAGLRAMDEFPIDPDFDFSKSSKHEEKRRLDACVHQAASEFNESGPCDPCVICLRKEAKTYVDYDLNLRKRDAEPKPKTKAPRGLAPQANPNNGPYKREAGYHRFDAPYGERSPTLYQPHGPSPHHGRPAVYRFHSQSGERPPTSYPRHNPPPHIENPKPFVCTHPGCPASFNRSSDFTKHKRFHEKLIKQAEDLKEFNKEQGH